MDSSFIANPTPINPLSTLSQVVGVGNALLGRQLTQQEIQRAMLGNQMTQRDIAANLAQSQARAQNVNPDGSINQAGVLQAEAANPDAQWNLAPEQAAVGATGQALTAASQAHFNLQSSFLNAAADAIGSSLQDPQNTPAKTRANLAETLLARGVPEDKVLDVMEQFPDSMSPEALNEKLITTRKDVLNVQEQHAANHPDYANTIQNGQNVATNTNPLAQAGTPQQFAYTLTPEQAAQPTQEVGPQGQALGTTLGQYQTDVGGAGGHVQMGPTAQTTALWDAAAQRQIARSGDALTQAQTQKSAAEEAIQLLPKAMNTGAGSPELQRLTGIFNTLHIPIDSQNLNNTGVLNKLLQQSTNAAAQSMGFNESDARMAALTHGMPDPTTQTKAALQYVLAYSRSQALGQIAMKNWIDQHSDPYDRSSIYQAEKAWQANYDPNAMFVATLPVAEQKEFLEKQSPTGKYQDAPTYKAMQRMGMLGAQRDAQGHLSGGMLDLAHQQPVSAGSL